MFEKVFKELAKSGAEYLVIGGVAVNLYGYLRYTGNIDLLVPFNDGNLKKIKKVVKEVGGIDVLVKKSLEFDKFFEKRLVKRCGNVRIPVVSVEDLINMKKNKKRFLDRMDCVVLNVVMGLEKGGSNIVEAEVNKEFDLEALKFWMKGSTKARLNWLETAFEFGKQFEKI